MGSRFVRWGCGIELSVRKVGVTPLVSLFAMWGGGIRLSSLGNVGGIVFAFLVGTAALVSVFDSLGQRHWSQCSLVWGRGIGLSVR